MKGLLSLILIIVIVAAFGYIGINAVGEKIPSAQIKLFTTPTTVTVSGPVILYAIRNQVKLETTSMVLANDQDISKIWGVEGACRESLTYLGYYTVTAGIDLQDIPEKDIKLDGSGDPAQTTVTLNLPPANILHVELDTQRSRVVQSNPSILSQICGTQLPEMVTEAQTNLRKSAEVAAKQQNIINMAQDRASFELKKLLLQLGFTRVNIQFTGSANDQ